MERWLYMVGTNCTDPSREAEFNDWYNNTHLPDVLETPGIVRATRYQNRDPSQQGAKFLAVYEVETNDIDKTMAELQAALARKRAQGRWTQVIQVVYRSLHREINPPLSRKR